MARSLFYLYSLYSIIRYKKSNLSYNLKAHKYCENKIQSNTYSQLHKYTYFTKLKNIYALINIKNSIPKHTLLTLF